MSDTNGRSFPKDPIVLAAVIGGLHEAFRSTHLSLCAVHGNRAGPWLDELQDEVTTAIKQAHAEGVSIEKESSAYTASLGVVGDVFADVRRALSKHERLRGK